MKIFAIIVCYHPKISALINLCENLIISNCSVVLVNNSIDFSLSKLVKQDIYLIDIDRNIGIAAAQNLGIQHAMKNNADIFVFFDQDSEIEIGFLNQLIEPISLDEPIVTTPIFIDKKEGFRFPSFKLNQFGLPEKVKIFNKDMYDVDLIISSGSATNRKTIDIVGLMNEDYFIDFVDTEWSLRCVKRKIPLKVIPRAQMLHTIGDMSIDLIIMRLFVHSPVRSYYKLRNSFLFAKSPYVPLLFGLKEIISAVVHSIATVVIVRDRKKYLYNYFQAVIDGITGKIGKKQ